nr:PAS domain-containing protein [Marivibrio halodurans]
MPLNVNEDEDKDKDGPVEVAGLDVVRQPELRDLAVYWMSLRQEGRLPTRAMIDPIDIPWALDRLYLATREETPSRWRYVLAGQQIADTFQRNTLRGVGLDEILSPEGLATVVDRWSPVEHGDVIYMDGMIYRAAERFVQGGRLLLPLGDDDGNVVALLGMTVTEAQPRRLDPSEQGTYRVWRIRP